MRYIKRSGGKGVKKKYLILVLAVAAVAAAGAGTSLALHTDESARLVNTISEKTLGVTEKSKIQIPRFPFVETVLFSFFFPFLISNFVVEFKIVWGFTFW